MEWLAVGIGVIYLLILARLAPHLFAPRCPICGAALARKEITGTRLSLNKWRVILMGKDIQPYAFKGTHIWEFKDLASEPVEQVRILRDRIRTRVQNLIAEIRIAEFDSVTTASEWHELILCLANA